MRRVSPIATTEEVRRSLRLQGLPPEFGLLPNPTRSKKKMTVEDSDKKSDGTPTILTYQLPRKPCVFSGDKKQDASR
ncbi:hypothetical protein AVEN_7140-1 [Araneus ventricosus]|uniref:Uncharacterized protein n=1 Tax=Araneus ventricosus TaxID=182803 RepID=A0A4Y2AKX1_ARAVE|nr:hypothetical protein AVEN_7140-1 [Araneus ventricosus]